MFSKHRSTSYKRVQNSWSISHGLNEYHRAEEGSEKRCYEFLLGAVRRHLDRERLESNRDRVARNLAGAQRASTPAVGGEKKPYIPKGYRIKWNRGGCSDDQCKFKHETPAPIGEGTQAESRAEVDLLHTEVIRLEYASFGSREDAIGAMIASSNMKANQVSPGRQHQPDQDQTILRVAERRKSRSNSRSKSVSKVPQVA